ncbi:MAG: response regulator, partial [Gammaproteobacteria bacterium]|nr:response regulator [Gammaproteobacteria bacterium]
MSHSQKIWVIDDDNSIRWVLEKALQKAGLMMESFDNAGSVLEALQHEEPALIISDIRMPGMDGLELLEHINVLYPKLPVIIM